MQAGDVMEERSVGCSKQFNIVGRTKKQEAC